MNAETRDRNFFFTLVRNTAWRRLAAPLCLTLTWQTAAAAELDQANAETLSNGVDQRSVGVDELAELDREHSLFREQFSNGDYAAALESAKRVISLSIEAYGPEDVNVARALNNLAMTQAVTGDLVAARENFDAAIALREKISESVIDPGLVNALRGLAGVYMASNDAELAIPVYERAIHITHVNEGPQNLEQVPLMEGLTRAYLEIGEINDAKKLQDMIYNLHRRRFSVKDDQFLDAVLRRGAWYHRLGFFDEEVMLYRRMIRSIEQNFGGDSPRLIQPLIRLGFAAALQQGVDTKYEEGSRAASRAVRIARENPDIGKERLARTLLYEGDFSVMTGQPRKSRDSYAEAWEILSSSEDLLPIREAELEQPVIVQRQYPESVYKRDAAEGEAYGRLSRDRGYVEVEYVVGTYGRPLQVEVIDSEPPGLLDVHVARRVKEFRYRPMMRNGEPVDSDVQKFRHEFRYRKDRLSKQDRRRIENLRERRRARAEKQQLEAEAVADENADGQP